MKYQLFCVFLQHQSKLLNINMDLSIVIPVFQVEKYIRSCIESIFQQGLDEGCYEVIIVDDGTKDRSMDVIADIIEQHTNITVIHQENQGLSVARNVGIAHAKGEYILRPDSDDLLIENSLPVLLKKALNTKADMIRANFLIMSNQEIEDQCQSPTLPQPEFIEKEGWTLLRDDIKLYQFYVWNTLFRRSFLQDNNILFIPGIAFQDVPFIHECCVKSKKAIKTTCLLNIYRRGHDSVSSLQMFTKKKGLDFCIAIAATWELTHDKTLLPEASQCVKKNVYYLKFNLLYRLLHHIDRMDDRVEVLNYLYQLAPDLQFTDTIAQRTGRYLAHKAPRIYFHMLSLRWWLNRHLFA